MFRIKIVRYGREVYPYWVSVQLENFEKYPVQGEIDLMRDMSVEVGDAVSIAIQQRKKK